MLKARTRRRRLTGPVVAITALFVLAASPAAAAQAGAARPGEGGVRCHKVSVDLDDRDVHNVRVCLVR
jgi:hypothetical protein